MNNTIMITCGIMLFISNILIVHELLIVKKNTLNNKNIQQLEEKKWHDVAYKDGLTLLDNRRSYIEEMDIIERTSNKHTVVHAVMIDVDNFKRVNDSFGHRFGDSVLKKTADFIRQYFPSENCKAFRIGGDEFAVIVNGTTTETLGAQIEHIAKISMEQIGCSLSIGYARVKFGLNKAMETAFEQADRNMYLMKESKFTNK